MDVDRLGKIFSEGLEERSISRISTLSSLLDLFFMGHINNIAKNFNILRKVCKNCEAEKIEINNNEKQKKEFYRPISNICSECEKYAIPTIYVTYSGGDDLLVFGPYDDIIQFAGKVRKEFKEWTCKNPYIDISGGIFIGSPKFPVGRAASITERYLELSKSHGGSKITVLDETMPWDSKGKFKGFYERLKFGEKLEEFYESRKISKSFIYFMLMLRQMTSDNIDAFNESLRSKEEIEVKSYVPYFVYKLRNIKDLSLREELRREGIDFIPWIKFPVSWVSLRTKEE